MFYLKKEFTSPVTKKNLVDDEEFDGRRNHDVTGPGSHGPVPQSRKKTHVSLGTRRRLVLLVLTHLETNPSTETTG